MKKWRYRSEDEKMDDDALLKSLVIKSLDNSDTDGDTVIQGIRIINNKVLFYADVDEGSILELNRVLLQLDAKLQTIKCLDENYDPIIHLHVNTYGGSIFAAFAAIDTIRRLKSKIYTYVDGSVASAGTLLIAVGHRRFIGQYSHLLIHQLSSGVYGKFAEIEDEFFNCSNLMKISKDFYKKYTKMPMKKLEEILKRDIWLNAQECLEYGIVDEIL